jgi:hypothetical protein
MKKMLHLFTKNAMLACLFLLFAGQLAATTYT